MSMPRRCVIAPVVLVVLGMACASCSRSGRVRMNYSDGAPSVGVAYIANNVVAYEAWDINLWERRPIQNPMTPGAWIGDGTVLCIHDSQREARRLEFFAMSGRAPSDQIEQMSFNDWNALGYDGWLWFGHGIWSDGLIPSNAAERGRPKSKGVVSVWDILEEQLPKKFSSCVVVSIVPPVFGMVDRSQHECLLDHGCRAVSLGGFMCASRDLECSVSALWCVRPSEDGEGVIAHSLLPAGTTMTIREVFDRGPSLWQADLDAMREWVAPRVFEDPKGARKRASAGAK